MIWRCYQLCGAFSSFKSGCWVTDKHLDLVWRLVVHILIALSVDQVGVLLRLLLLLLLGWFAWLVPKSTDCRFAEILLFGLRRMPLRINFPVGRRRFTFWSSGLILVGRWLLSWDGAGLVHRFDRFAAIVELVGHHLGAHGLRAPWIFQSGLAVSVVLQFLLRRNLLASDVG